MVFCNGTDFKLFIKPPITLIKYYCRAKKTKMKFINCIFRIIASIFGGFASFVFMWYVFGELLAVWYMHQNAILNRIDLSEDMGFGMIMTLLLVVCFAIFFPLGAVLSWRGFLQANENQKRL